MRVRETVRDTEKTSFACERDSEGRRNKIISIRGSNNNHKGKKRKPNEKGLSPGMTGAPDRQFGYFAVAQSIRPYSFAPVLFIRFSLANHNMTFATRYYYR